MTFWTYLGFVDPPRRLVAYSIDPAAPERGLPIGTIPALPSGDETRMRLSHNPADYECIRDQVGHHRVILHWFGGLVDAVCFETEHAARRFPGFAHLTRDDMDNSLDHFTGLVTRGNRIFKELDWADDDVWADDYAAYGRAA